MLNQPSRALTTAWFNHSYIAAGQVCSQAKHMNIGKGSRWHSVRQKSIILLDRLSPDGNDLRTDHELLCLSSIEMCTYWNREMHTIQSFFNRLSPGCDFKCEKFQSKLGEIYLSIQVDITLEWMLGTSLMVSHYISYLFGQWLGAVRQQGITWSSVDQDLWYDMVSLGHNELIHWGWYEMAGVLQMTFKKKFLNKNFVTMIQI